MQAKPTLMSMFSRPSNFEATVQKAPKKPKTNLNNGLEDDPLYKILSWRDKLPEPQIPQQGTFLLRKVPSVISDNQLQWGSNFQGILIDVDWSQLSFEQFKKLELSDNIISNGIVFIWGASYNIEELFDYFASQNFQYVENFMFVMLERSKIPAKKNNEKNNLFNYFKKSTVGDELKIQEDGKDNKKQKKDYETGKVGKVQEIFMEKEDAENGYFKQTQRVLYMFRKHHKSEPLELRHQRTSDAFFTIGDDWNLDSKSMETVYRMIETLLIKANYHKGQPLKLLQLWGKQNGRKGWVTITEENSQ